METLYNATLQGDEQLLLKLLHEYPLILEQCIVDKSRYYGQSTLHVAATMGHLNIIDILLQTKPNMCFMHDQDGMTPIHVAAINGKTDALEKLYHAKPHANRERTNDGETVLHLCIKHNNMDVLEFLLDHVDAEMLNSKDNDGNTILHLAVIGNQSEMVEMLLKHKLIEINAINKNGLTAMDSHLLLTKGYQSYKDVMSNIFTSWKDGDRIGPLLNENTALRAKDAIKMNNRDSWVENESNALMVVASLIATMAFQVGVNPPGGVWQDDGDPPSNVPLPHYPGDAVKAYNKLFHPLMIFNTTALVSSLSVILLLISGLPRGPLC